jgi:hypothetical protein
MKNAALLVSRRVLYDAEYILYLYKYANQTQISCAPAFYSKIFRAPAAALDVQCTSSTF